MPYSIISTFICKLGIRVENETITKIDFVAPEAELIIPKDKLSKLAAEQFQAYCENPHFKFDLPIIYHGTAFQQQLWKYLPTIITGTTQTYTEVAQALNSGARAIGNACRRNPLPLIFPCHRVVAKHKLGGFSGHQHGYYLSIKEKLLTHEGVQGKRI
ncbi:MAG: methylated-DNA--[protein]-cysteine S-methyltransferase [Gammaproteobacteria bacterium]